MIDLFPTIYSFLMGTTAQIIQFVLIVVYLFLIKKFKISGQKTALIGFVLLGISSIFVLMDQNSLAGIAAGYVFLLFVCSFIQELYHFLRYDNK